MLVLTRRLNETIEITGGITVRVLKISGSQVKLGLTAPEGIEIVRGPAIPGRTRSSTKDTKDTK